MLLTTYVKDKNLVGRKPRCFVAMAFDRSDTDDLYAKTIAPLLKRNRIIPVIINRRQDNRDINIQIIEQIKSCDFCVADLTYARPSVYYEAGYAERKMQVIYTVRTDHLGKNHAEDARIHFDLQMKPIIAWRSPSDATFKRKLEGRIRNTFLKEFRRKSWSQKEIDRQRTRFRAKSVDERVSLLRRHAVAAWKRQGFSLWSWFDLEFPRLSQKSRVSLGPLKELGASNICLILRRQEGNALRIASVLAFDAVPVSRLRSIAKAFGPGYPYFVQCLPEDGERNAPVRRSIENHSVLSLRNVPDKAVRTAMPFARWESSGRCYSFRASSQLWPRHQEIPRNVMFHFLDRIDRISQLKESLSSVALQLVSRRTIR